MLGLHMKVHVHGWNLHMHVHVHCNCTCKVATFHNNKLWYKCVVYNGCSITC